MPKVRAGFHCFRRFTVSRVPEEGGNELVTEVNAVSSEIKRQIPVVAFAGKSGSGKTTLLEKVVRELKLRGLRVAVIKHSHHEIEIDQPGKDSWRFAQAGSDVVAISSPGKLVFIEQTDSEYSLDKVTALVQDKVDIVLLEGYNNSAIPKILVLGAGQNLEVPGGGDILAVVSPRISALGTPEFNDEEVTGVTRILLTQMNHPAQAEQSSRVFSAI